MNINETTYWVALASMPKMWTRRKNQLFVACYTHTPRYSIIDLFEQPNVRAEIGVTPDEEQLFDEIHGQLANTAFMVEDLLNQGYEILPITSPYYPQSLKKSLKQGAPCVVYVKGDKSLLNRPSTAVVGSRNADSLSLQFTDNVAAKAVRENKTIVSGFAKGVDRQALDAALNANGTSIIVLPQGITTFTSGFRQYYQPIYQGKVAVISTFHPKAPWSVEFAMARNSIIYGMAEEIYVAQSDSKGGTWAGVIDGLKKGQTIYVRVPQNDERNANMQLIQKGCVGVDLYGNAVDTSTMPDVTTHFADTGNNINEDDIKKLILDKLVDKKTSKEIIAATNPDLSDAKIKKILRSMPEIVETKHGSKIYFAKKSCQEPSLFDNI